MYHMKTFNVRDLRYRFSEVEAALRAGSEIEISKRRRVIARLSPVRPSRRAARPDFLARLKTIYGRKLLKVSGAELLAEERGRF
jgi:antitoxin (DNA-binding transcriptional repressor) of toxin-antitoxin stability system